MDCSQNELTALLYKAAVGCGVPVGLAEDLAKAAVWLTARGHDAIGPLLDVLSDSANDLSPFARAQSAVDMAVASPSVSVPMPNLPHPILLIGLAGVAARSASCRFTVELGTGGSAVVDAIDAEISGECPDRCDLGLSAAPIEASEVTAVGRPYLGAVAVADDLWQRASSHAAKTYVPATEASRLKGAGAGLTDND